MCTCLRACVCMQGLCICAGQNYMEESLPRRFESPVKLLSTNIILFIGKDKYCQVKMPNHSSARSEMNTFNWSIVSSVVEKCHQLSSRTRCVCMHVSELFVSLIVDTGKLSHTHTHACTRTHARTHTRTHTHSAVTQST